jgi:hypothetical protein
MFEVKIKTLLRQTTSAKIFFKLGALKEGQMHKNLNPFHNRHKFGFNTTDRPTSLK